LAYNKVKNVGGGGAGEILRPRRPGPLVYTLPLQSLDTWLVGLGLKVPS
jgi:hypothetical protein